MTLLCLSFVSGLPFLLTLSTLSFWLSEVGVSKTHISLLLLAGIPYSVKFLWAPFLDQVRLPYITHRLGHRRSWALLAHMGLMGALLCLGWSNPSENLLFTFIATFAVSLCAATLDTVVDAYRIELLPDEDRAMGASVEAIV
ncbi:MAG: MFS transporter, partial [Alphaproteobacteria bacterium]|nr:MFS transporter [Alphaproteobacteria bacterium]